MASQILGLEVVIELVGGEFKQTGTHFLSSVLHHLGSIDALKARNAELEGQIQHRNGNLAFSTAVIDEKNDRITKLEAQLNKAKAEGIREAVETAQKTDKDMVWVKDLLACADSLEAQDNG